MTTRTEKFKKSIAEKLRHWARQLDPYRGPAALLGEVEAGPDDLALVYIVRGVDREEPFDVETSMRDPFSGEIICELTK